MEVNRLESLEQKLVAVVLDDDGIFKGQGGVGDVDVNVGEAVGTVVAVGNQRRHHNHIAPFVGQVEIVEVESSASLGAVDQLPAAVGVAADSQGEKMLPNINDVIHIITPQFEFSTIIPKSRGFVHG